MANYGVFFGTGLLDRAQLDIAAAVRALRERGFRRIVLLGYSMGSTMVTHYQAVNAPPEVIGVCTLAHPLSLPLSLRRRWERFESRPSYNEMCSIVAATWRAVTTPNAIASSLCSGRRGRPSGPSMPRSGPTAPGGTHADRGAVGGIPPLGRPAAGTARIDPGQ